MEQGRTLGRLNNVYERQKNKLERRDSNTRFGAEYSQPTTSCLVTPFPVITQYSVILLAVKNSQNSQEQVNDVQIQTDGRSDLLFNMVVAQHELSIDQDIGAEDECADPAVNQLAGAGLRKEHVHEAEEDEGPEGAEEVRHPGSEVVFGLAGKERQEDEYTCRQDHGVEDYVRLVERDYYADGVCFGQREGGEEEEVSWVGVPLPVGEEHEADCTEELSRH